MMMVIVCDYYLESLNKICMSAKIVEDVLPHIRNTTRRFKEIQTEGLSYEKL